LIVFSARNSRSPIAGSVSPVGDEHEDPVLLLGQLGELVMRGGRS
jgi:hypothetical protein